MTDRPRPGAPPPRRAKHLMDLGAPRPTAPSRPGMSLTHVQMWVMSVLAVSTGLHMSAGVVAAAYFVENGAGAQVGLLVIAGLFGVGSVLAGRAIHQKRLLSWWVLLGWAPALVGGYLVFGA